MRFLHRFFSRLLLASLSLFITAVILLCFVYTYLELQLPNVNILKDVHFEEPLRVYSQDGKLIGEYGTNRRIPITLAQVPKQMIQAVLATEDVRFYSHPGVDFVGLIRAAVAVISTGRRVQGASTITMQVARNFFNLTRKKVYSRKIKEILLALKIDREFPKDKILELYLNQVYFGNRAYGIAAAAEVYYGKKLDELSLPEIAMLAGLPQAPSRDNPLVTPVEAVKRRDHVLERMYEVGFINKATYEKAIQTPNTATYHGQRIELVAPYVGEMARQAMVTQYGDAAYDLGLKVYTTVSSKLQVIANNALDDGLVAYSVRHGFERPKVNFGKPSSQNRLSWQQRLQFMEPAGNLTAAVVWKIYDHSLDVLLGDGAIISLPWEALTWGDLVVSRGIPLSASDIAKPGDQIWLQKDLNAHWRLAQIPKVQGAIVTLNPQNGAVLALSGGFDFQESNYNRAIQAQRQPGSNFKPFIYSAALDKGFTLATVLNDAPVVIHDYNGEIWRPVNDEFKFYGPTRLRVALTKSRNLASIRLLQMVGVKYAVDYLSRFGFDSKQLPHSLSLALGSPTLTPLQIANGYAVFANGGFKVTPYLIEKEVAQNGQILFQASPVKACEACILNPNLASNHSNPVAPETLSPQNAYLITNVLQDVIKTGTAHAAIALDRSDLAGKTGTNGINDAWFSGFNSDLVSTVWVGYDNYQPVNELGAKAALPIWMEFMSNALRNEPLHSMPEPPGIITARINPTTGLLARPGQNGIFEIFYGQNTAHDNSSPVISAETSTDDDSGNNVESNDITSSSSNSSSNSGEPLF